MEPTAKPDRSYREEILAFREEIHAFRKADAPISCCLCGLAMRFRPTHDVPLQRRLPHSGPYGAGACTSCAGSDPPGFKLHDDGALEMPSDWPEP